MIEEFKHEIMSEYELTDLGLMKYSPRMQVTENLGWISLSQEKYIKYLLKKFNMINCKPT